MVLFGCNSVQIKNICKIYQSFINNIIKVRNSKVGLIFYLLCGSCLNIFFNFKKNVYFFSNKILKKLKYMRVNVVTNVDGKVFVKQSIFTLKVFISWVKLQAILEKDSFVH